MTWSYIYHPYMYFEGLSPILYYDTIFFEKMKYKEEKLVLSFTYICYNVYMHECVFFTLVM
jgi:hypothetical protein